MVKYVQTVMLTGSEEHITNLAGTHTEIINFSDDYIYASVEAGVAPNKDNVMAIPGQSRDYLPDTNGDFYILGTGKVELRGTDYRINFKGPSPITTSGGSGGGGTSGVSQTYVDLQDASILKQAMEYADSLQGVKSGIIFNTHLNFPPLGETDTLYIAIDENVIYRWDNEEQIYVALTASDMNITDVVFNVEL